MTFQPVDSLPQTCQQLATELGERLQTLGWHITTAESCTGGGIASTITSVAGSSGWFDMGFVTYSNHAKQQLLGVHAVTLAAFGAVSEQVVQEMAEGALRVAAADIAVAVSGIAGPGGGSADKPVGTVCIGYATAAGATSETCLFPGDREAVRMQTVVRALAGVLQRLAEP